MGDPAASTLAKLKNKSKKLDIQFQQLLVLFSNEELLRRIALSDYKDNFVLKGGYLIYSISQFEFRPTVDSDYLIKDLTMNPKRIKKVIDNIINQETNYSYVTFEIKNYENITEQMKYKGIRVNLISKIKNTRTHINIDMGTGDDYLSPEPKSRNLLTILNDFEKPNILTYSLDSVVSEKIDSIIYRMETNSRMKDFFDIYFLLKNYNFSGNRLKEAIQNTLNNRNREYPEDAIKALIRLKNNTIMNKRWKIFCQKTIKQNLEYDIIIKSIIKFLDPPYKAFYNNIEFNKNWKPKKQEYN